VRGLNPKVIINHHPKTKHPLNALFQKPPQATQTNKNALKHNKKPPPQSINKAVLKSYIINIIINTDNKTKKSKLF